MKNLYKEVHACLMQADIECKLKQAQDLYQQWQAGELKRLEAEPVIAIPVPGRPEKPELVPPAQVKQRKLTTDAGRAALLHAVAHIEFNAINLALDAAYRFRNMPEDYYGDWLQVAAEEAYHFSLLRDRMQSMNVRYGDMPAHNGLWEQACKTDDDVMVRMALVPRVLEARGLDVTPGMMQRLKSVGDHETVEILEIILRDEIGHVRIGSRWYRHCCELRGLEPEETFRRLLKEVMGSPLRSPFYTEGRLQAGFTQEELDELLKLEKNWLEEIKS